MVNAEEAYPLTRTWVYSVEANAWEYDDSPEISCLGQGLALGDSPLIDDLLGTIDAQIPVPGDDTKPTPAGWIDDWAFSGIIQPSILKGLETGEVLLQSIQAVRDWDETQFEMLFESQNIGSFTNRRTLKSVLMTAWAPDGGNMVVEFAHGRQQWIKQKTASMLAYTTVRPQQVGAPYTQITGNEVRFRVRAKWPVWITELWVRMLEKSRQRQVKT